MSQWWMEEEDRRWKNRQVQKIAENLRIGQVELDLPARIELLELLVVNPVSPPEAVNKLCLLV